jgi:hypothetical protein
MLVFLVVIMSRNGRWLSPLTARRCSWRAITAWMLLLTGLAIVGLTSVQTPRPLVYVVPVEGMIDLGLAPLLARTIDEAEQAGGAAVVLDINTLGGRVDAAIVMRDVPITSRRTSWRAASTPAPRTRSSRSTSPM